MGHTSHEFSLGVDLHTIPPNSQGYLTLGAASSLDGIDLGETDDDRWAHLTIEASKVAGFDRPQVLGDRADGTELLAAIAAARPAQCQCGKQDWCSLDKWRYNISLYRRG